MTQFRKYIFITFVSLIFFCSTLRNSPFPPKFPVVCPCFAMFSDVSHRIIGIGTAIVALLRRFFCLTGTMMMSALCSRCSRSSSNNNVIMIVIHWVIHSSSVLLLLLLLYFRIAFCVCLTCRSILLLLLLLLMLLLC